MLTRSKARKEETKSNQLETQKEEEADGKVPRNTETQKRDHAMTEPKSMVDKMQELHDLLVTMSEQFQGKLTEISNKFQTELAATKEELNEKIEQRKNSVNVPMNEDSTICCQAIEPDTSHPVVQETSTHQSLNSSVELPQQTLYTARNSCISCQSAGIQTAHLQDTASATICGQNKPSDKIIPSHSERADNRRFSNVNECHKPFDKNVIYVKSDQLEPLPIFDGKPTEWHRFIGKFHQSTERHGYGDIENSERLNTALVGPAHSLVEPLLFNPKNVRQILSDLEERFGREDVLVDEQISIIRNFHNIREGDIKSVIDLADKVRNCKNFLTNCDCESYLDNPLLVKEVVKKLALSKKEKWAEHESKISPRATLKNLSEWLTELARFMQRIDLTDDSTQSSPEKNGKSPEKCDACEDKHSLDICPTFAKMSPQNRFEFARNLRVCFCCLRKGHPTRFCRNRKACIIEGCIHKHHLLLHVDGPSTNADDFRRVSKCSEVNNSSKILFQIIPIKIYGPKGMIQTFGMFDGGADVSVMDEGLAKQLGINGVEHTLNLKWIDQSVRKITSQISDISISGDFDKAPIFKLHNVRIVKDLNLPTQTLNMSEINSKYYHTRNIPMNSYTNAQPKLLLGLNEFKLSISRQKPIFDETGPIATQTELGWMVYGTTDPNQKLTRTTMNTICFTHEEENEIDLRNLDILVKKFISSDDFGSSEQKSFVTKEDRRAIEIMRRTTKRVENKYESGLLWKFENIKLPNNFSFAAKRFECIERKMEKDPAYKQIYESKVQEYVDKGYAVELTMKESKQYKDRTWYLPHFGVLNKNKPGKFRLVFDAAAKFNGVSLNSALLSGPDLNQPLIKVLFQFREKRIGVCGDIKEMFHQVNIIKDDQDAQRFLFRSSKNQPWRVFKMKAMTFGSTCSPTTAQFVKNHNAELFLRTHPKAVEAIWKNHYVDDFVCSFNNEEDAIQITKDVIKIHNYAGFNLRGFLSNSSKVSETLNCYQTTEEVNMDIGGDNMKVLGLYWNLKLDCFKFKTNTDRIDDQILKMTQAPTKRQVLSIVMSLFDPFGFLGNYMINGKLLLQNIWKEGLKWDERISGNLFQIWKQWLQRLTNVEHLSIPRCHFNNLLDVNVQLHVFVDASDQAFASVAYYRITRDDNTKVSFVCSKTKCAPLKYISIPRLELQAAVLGVRLMNHIFENKTVNIRETFFWSDSSTVLHWIKNGKNQYKQFVANRLSEIHESTKPENWFKIPTKENIADQATRASNYSGVFEDNQWLHGPKWLFTGTWPKETNFPPSKESETEIKTTKRIYTTRERNVAEMIKFDRFSNYMRLIRAAAWMLRFVKKCATKEKITGPLSSSEIDCGEMIVAKLVQRESFEREYHALSKNESVDKSSSLYNTNPMIDKNELIRVNGRIDNAPTIPLYTKNPIIFPKHHYVTELLVRYEHNKCKHQFFELTICEIRRKFWINDLRAVLNKVKSKCVKCKMLYSKPQAPLMGPHPEDRLTPFIRPFTFTGVDYFGPVNISVGRRQEKRWVAIFTCLTIRAVHTEIAENLSSDACIICIKNFINIRGVPKRMRSDNGSNFVGINGELKSADEIFGQEKVQNELAIRGIEWKYNIPSNPSAGGCWENMVKMIKRILTQSLKEVAPRTETLRTFLIEACNIINSRPLTHVPTTTLDEEPLTANHFLLGEPNCIQPFTNKEEQVWTLRKQWKIASNLKNHFWKSFVREYIPTLNRRSKDFKPTPPMKVGDIVLIADDNLVRNAWPRGVIIDVFLGKDGQIRSVLLRTQNKELKRPVCKIAVIGTIDTQQTN